MTILVCIPNYGTSNRDYLKRTLSEYASFTHYQLDIHLLLTDEIDVSEFTSLKITKHFYPKEIGHFLTHTHKQIFTQNIEKFDYFLYIEDDILLKEVSIDVFMECSKILPENMVCGFLRYEFKPNSEYTYLIDCHPEHSVHRGGGRQIIRTNYKINDIDYLELHNVHQGCSLLSRNQLLKVIGSGFYFLDHRHGGYAGILESAASDIYWRGTIIKVTPRNKINELLIHHLPNKYVNMLPDVYREDIVPDNNKLKVIENEFNRIVL